MVPDDQLEDPGKVTMIGWGGSHFWLKVSPLIVIGILFVLTAVLRGTP